MIAIDKLSNILIDLDKEIIPPQLDSMWSRIIDSDVKTCYAAIYSENNKVKEQMNFCVSKCSFGNVLIPLPYASYGSLFDPKNTIGVKEMLVELENFARDMDCILFTISTHPLSQITFGEHKNILDYDYSFRNFCQISDVSIHPLKRLSHHRRMAFKNEISKIDIFEELYIDKSPDISTFNLWFDVYTERFKEFGSVPLPYKFYYNYWEESQKRKNVDFWVITNGVDVIGGVFIIIGKNIADYGTSVFDMNYGFLYPTTHLLNQYFNKMNDDGVRYFNWQSSPARNDGVYNYKKRWGAKEYEHYYFSKLLVDVEYIQNIPLETVKKEMVGSYMLPYSIWGGKIKGDVQKNG